MIRIVIIIFLPLLIYSCGNESIEADGVIEGQEYFPVEKGMEWIYSSDSIVYDKSTGLIDTLRGFIKEVITSKDEEGNFVIERSFGIDTTSFNVSKNPQRWNWKRTKDQSQCQHWNFYP